jgi:hypothetical protein
MSTFLSAGRLPMIAIIGRDMKRIKFIIKSIVVLDGILS